MSADPHHELLRHQAFLHRLAQSLVGDMHAAQDIVQDASAAYLSAPPRDVEASRAWLARVVRRLAGKRQRLALRQGDRERDAARSESVESGIGRIDSELDAQSTLVELVQTLPAPQREAVVMRFHQENTPAQIAAHLDTSVHTVNTRLRRALEQLRQEMDRSSGGDRQVWSVALLPGLRTTYAAGAAASILGIWTMATMAKWSAAAIVIAVGVSLLRHESSTGRIEAVPVEKRAEQDVVELASVAEAKSARATVPVTTPVAADVPAAEPVEATASARSLWMIDVIIEGEGVEVKPTELIVTGINGYNWEETHALQLSVPAPGRSEFDLRELVKLWDAQFVTVATTGVRIRVEHPDSISQTVVGPIVTDGSPGAKPSERASVRAVLSRSSVVTGHVTFADPERATKRAVVAYSIDGSEPADGGSVGCCTINEDGTFRLRMTTAGTVAIAVLASDHRPQTRIAAVSWGDAYDVGEIKIGLGHELSGRLTWGGSPVASGARVEVRMEGPHEYWSVNTGVIGFMPDLCWLVGQFELYRCFIDTTDDGRFAVAGLAREPVRLRLNSLPDRRVQYWGDGWGPFSAPTRVDLELNASPIDVYFDFGSDQPSDGVIAASSGEVHEIRSGLDAKLVGNSPWRFAVTPNTPVTLSVAFEGYARVEGSVRSASVAGELVKKTIRVIRPDGVGALSIAPMTDGEPIPDGTQIQFDFYPHGESEASDPMRRSAQVEGGLATINNLPIGPLHVRAYIGSTWQGLKMLRLDVEFDFTVATGVAHERRCEFRWGGNVLFEARDPTGRLIDMQWKHTILDGTGGQVDCHFQTVLPSSLSGGWTDRGPSELVRNLPVGNYSVQLRHPDYHDMDAPFEVLANEVTRKVFELRPR